MIQSPFWDIPIVQPIDLVKPLVHNETLISSSAIRGDVHGIHLYREGAPGNRSRGTIALREADFLAEHSRFA